MKSVLFAAVAVAAMTIASSASADPFTQNVFSQNTAPFKSELGSDKSYIKSSDIGAFATGAQTKADYLSSNVDRTPVVQNSTAINNGLGETKLNLKDSVLDGGTAMNANQDGATSVAGLLGVEGRTSVSIENKSSAIANTVGARAEAIATQTHTSN